MNEDRIYMVSDIEGFTPMIGRLVSMMNYARWTTLNSIKALTQVQLDFQLDEKSNSIGALLMHIAGVEYSYYISTLSERNFTDADRAEWMPAIKLGQEAREKIKGRPLDYYLSALSEVREETLKALRGKTDAWLDEFVYDRFLKHKPVNNHFKWFHVFEDEITHRGQIRMIRKRIPEVESIV